MSRGIGVEESVTTRPQREKNLTSGICTVAVMAMSATCDANHEQPNTILESLKHKAFIPSFIATEGGNIGTNVCVSISATGMYLYFKQSVHDSGRKQVLTFSNQLPPRQQNYQTLLIVYTEELKDFMQNHQASTVPQVKSS